MSSPWFAISVKQPWAALLAVGAKTLEIRTWKTQRRGPLLIHASKVPDLRPEAWAWVTTPALRELAQLGGGVIAAGELTDCKHYATKAAFQADHGLHLNDPDWFREEGLYGFQFRRVQLVPFFATPGNTFFFPVDGFALKLPPQG